MPRKPSLGGAGRTVNNANIKEVPLVENLPPPEPVKATLPKAIEEDAATKELRRKIEDQKKLREQILRVKEERRKLAAMQRQKDLLEQRLLATQGPPVTAAPSSAAVMPTSAGVAAGATASTSALTSQQPQGPQKPPSAIGVKQRLGPRATAVSGPPAQQAIPTQEGQVLKKVVIVRRSSAQPVRAPIRATQQGNIIPLTPQLVPLQRGSTSQRGGGGMSLVTPRKVIRIVSNNSRLPGPPPPGAPLPQARIPGAYGIRPPAPVGGCVLVSNLSVSTTEMGLRSLGRTCGVVNEVILDRKERQAVLKFKDHQQAVQFQKKYQRHMLDLSMIQVSLLPP